VPTIEKLIERLRRRPPDADFADIRRLLDHFGWYQSSAHGHGTSHVSFRSPDGSQRVTIPTIKGRKVKREYIDVVLLALGLVED
jgi:predicted RNA binding protein YcfA (HicA-like mRNA interferase family)